MPLGANRTDANVAPNTTFRNGQPVTLPHNFGQPVTLPKDFGNDVPQTPPHNTNVVNWTPSPAHFGNTVTPAEPTQDTPTFSPVAGSYTGAQSVTITSAGADSIYYTTDGSTPTTGSTLYTGAVSVATSETLKALAVKAGSHNSAIGSAAYTITIPITLLTHAIKTVKASSSATTGAIDTTGASVLIAAVGSYYGTNTLTDSKSNVWTKLTEYGAGGSGDTISIFYSFAPITDVAHTFTGDDLASQGFTTVMVAAFSGTNATSAVFEAGTDKGAAAGNGNPIQPGSVAVASIGDLYFTAVTGYANATLGVDSSFNIIDTDVLTANSLFGGCAYLVATGLTAVNPTWTPTGSSGLGTGTAIAAFAKA